MSLTDLQAGETNNSPVYLTIEGALQESKALGFDIEIQRMRRLATKRSFPFFRMGKQLYIARDELLTAFRKLQQEARERSEANDGNETSLEGQDRRAS
jgi:hypothetical protein